MQLNLRFLLLYLRCYCLETNNFLALLLKQSLQDTYFWVSLLDICFKLSNSKLEILETYFLSLLYLVNFSLKLYLGFLQLLLIPFLHFEQLIGTFFLSLQYILDNTIEVVNKNILITRIYVNIREQLSLLLIVHEL